MAIKIKSHEFQLSYLICGCWILQYKTEDEEELRWKTFKENLLLIDSSNDAELEAGGSAQFGITKFTDYTSEERMALIGSSAADLPDGFTPGTDSVDHSRGSSTATVVDWTGVYTTSVNDQGYCGSCWAFSVAEQIESDAIREGLITTNDKLSPQQLVNW